MTGRLVALVLVSIAVITAAVVLFTRRPDDTHLVAILPAADGISEGTTISYLGIEIGRVERLQIDKRPVVAELRITRPDAQLRKGDMLRSRRYGPFGDKILEVVQGRSSTTVMQDGDTIPFAPATPPTRLHAESRSIGWGAVDRIGPDEIAAALAGVAPNARGVVFPGSKDDHAQYVFNRRTAQSAVEQHDEWDDILIVQDGRGFVRHGGTWRNARPIYQNERRGGSLVNPIEVEIGRGDVVRIPAGEPHRIVADSASPLTYLVVKVRVRGRK